MQQQSVDVARAGPEYPRFDVGFRTFQERGQLVITVDVSPEECSEIMQQLAEYESDGFRYPENSRETVLAALFGEGTPVAGCENSD
jgi:hypothetical protein